MTLPTQSGWELFRIRTRTCKAYRWPPGRTLAGLTGAYDFVRQHGGETRCMSGSTGGFYLRTYPRGEQAVMPGCWIVDDPERGLRACSTEEFSRRYEPA